MLDFWQRFLLGVLATWRLAHLLADEDGPFDVIVKVRRRLGGSWLGRLLDCFYCLSFWIAAPFAFWVCEQPLDRGVAWIALSGGACLLQRFSERQSPPVNIMPIPGEEDNALLRSSTQRDED